MCAIKKNEELEVLNTMLYNLLMHINTSNAHLLNIFPQSTKSICILGREKSNTVTTAGHHFQSQRLPSVPELKHSAEARFILEECEE